MADVNTTQVNQALSGLSQEVQTLTASIRTLIASQSNIQNAQEARKRNMDRMNSDLSEYAATLRDNRKTTEEQEKLIKKAVEARKQELEALKKLKKATDDYQRALAANADDDTLNRLQKALEGARAAHKNAADTVRNYSNALEKSFSSLIKSTDWASLALTWFGSAVNTQARQLMSQNKANGGLVEGTGSLIEAMAAQQMEALKYKVDATTFANITNGARQMFNAMGGTSAGLKEITGAVDRFTIMTGSFADGLKIATQTANDFATKGIRPTAIGMELYQNDLVALRRQTGMTVDQAHELYNSVASDIDSIDLLRSARAGEREAILRSQRALIQQSIAAGMSAEQAREAAKMLNKMVAAKPLDRLKQAAKVRAMAGALGIAGGEEAAQAITAGKRATPEQQRMLQEFSQRAANAMDQAAGQGLGTEIFATTLLEKLDLEQYYGKNSAFSTTLGDSLKSANADLAKQFVDASKAPEAELLRTTLGMYEQLKLVASGANFLGPIFAGVAAIGAIMMKGQLLTGAGKLAEGVAGKLGVGTKAGTAAAEAAGGAARGASGAAGALGRVGSVLGPLGAVGLGAYEGYENYQQTGQMGQSVGKGVGTAAGAGVGGWGGAALGASIGTAILPGIGTIVGGLLGGLSGGLAGTKVGDFVGGKIGEQFDTKPASLPTTAPKKPTFSEQTQASVIDTSPIENATMQTAEGISQSVKRMDESNLLLKSMLELQQRQLTIAEKTLIASTMTDKEKTQGISRDLLRADTKFGSQYNYV